MSTPPRALSVGEIIRFIDGPQSPVRCVAEGETNDCPLQGKCGFMGMWTRARDAVQNVYNETTFQDLIDEELTAGPKSRRAGHRCYSLLPLVKTHSRLMRRMSRSLSPCRA